MIQLVFQYDRVNRVWKFVIEESLSEIEIRSVLATLNRHFFVDHSWRKENSAPTENVFYIHGWLNPFTSAFGPTFAKRIAKELGYSEFLYVMWDTGQDPSEQIYARAGGSARFRKVRKNMNSARVMEA